MNSKESNETILVTGAAGFIGAALVKSLLILGFKVIGIDNLNEYYSQVLVKFMEIPKHILNLKNITVM